MTPTTIRAFDVAPLDLALHTPFGIAGGAQDRARNALVTVVLEDGTHGYGEAAPLPAYNGETQEQALDALATAHPLVLGADARSWRAIAREVGVAIPGSGAARCAVETAVLDALTRSHGMSLLAFFGGNESSLVTDVTITTGTVIEAGAAARSWSAQGFRTLKIKVGGTELTEDVERVAAVHEAAPEALLCLDGNASLTADEARDLVGQLRARGIGIALFEQPVAEHDLPGLFALAADGMVIAADESAKTARATLALSALGAPHVVNVKLMKAGIAEALDVVAVARAAGMRLMIGGMVESVLSMTTSACFAAGLGGFSFVDLDTPLFFAEHPFTGGFAQAGPHLDLSGITAGHGVTPPGLAIRRGP